MKSTFRYLVLLLLAFHGSGCVTVARRGDFDNSIGQFIEMGNKVRDDYADKYAWYQGMTKATSTPKTAPYPGLGSALTSMHASWVKVDASNKILWKQRDTLDSLCEGRPDAESNRPTWPAFKKTLEETQATCQVMKEDAKGYSEASKTFVDLVNQNGIIRMDTAQVQGQLSTAIGQMDAALVQVRKSTADAKSKLDGLQAATLGVVQNREKRASLAKIEELSNSIEQEDIALKAKTKAFEDTIRGQKILWQGPGIPKVDIVADVVAASDRINKLAAQVNAEVDKFNK